MGDENTPCGEMPTLDEVKKLSENYTDFETGECNIPIEVIYNFIADRIREK